MYGNIHTVLLPFIAWCKIWLFYEYTHAYVAFSKSLYTCQALTLMRSAMLIVDPAIYVYESTTVGLIMPVLTLRMGLAGSAWYGFAGSKYCKARK